jgi:uncharacterized protein YlxW (UPF0749 family)
MKTLLKILAMVVLTGLMLSLTECNTGAHDTTQNNEKSFKDERNDLRKELQALRNDINQELEKIDQKLVQASGTTKMKLEHAKRKLALNKAKVEITLEKMEKASEDSWSDVKIASRNIVNDIRTSFKKAGGEIAQVLNEEND